MKLHVLEQAIDTFLQSQLQATRDEWYLAHELVLTFHQHWSSPEPQGLAAMYDDCLQSTISQRWWKRDHYRPKEIMLQLIAADPELATIAWKDLSNEAASLEGRLDRFDYYCQDLLQTLRQKNLRSVESHHHQDASVISLYLAGMHPDRYTLYPGLEVFQSFCRSVGRPDVPTVDDLARYTKVARIVGTYLEKNANYVRVLETREAPYHKVKCIPFQLSYECIRYEGLRYKSAAV